MIASAIIDLDNCISDDAWRMKHCKLHMELPNDRYHDYHQLCDQDEFKNEDIIKQLSFRHQLFIFTSRPECVRYKTWKWLHKHGIKHNQMLMRPDTDHTSSVELKRCMLKSVSSKFQFFHAIDDRIDILDMYADEGVPICRKVFIHHPKVIHP